MPITFRIARASAFVFLLVFTNLTAAGIDGSHATEVVAAANPKIAAPDQPGPFNVGVMVFSATMSDGRTTRVQVFYPTAEPVDCAMRYRIDYLAGFFELQSPFCARSNARAFPGCVSIGCSRSWRARARSRLPTSRADSPARNHGQPWFRDSRRLALGESSRARPRFDARHRRAARPQRRQRRSAYRQHRSRSHRHLGHLGWCRRRDWSRRRD